MPIKVINKVIEDFSKIRFEKLEAPLLAFCLLILTLSIGAGWILISIPDVENQEDSIGHLLLRARLNKK